MVGLLLLGCNIGESIQTTPTPTSTSTPIWVVVTVTPSPTPYPTSTPYPTYTPMPTYTPVPIPTSTPMPRPIAIWGRKEIADIYTDLKEDPNATSNRYLTQRIKVRGLVSSAYSDFVVVRWPIMAPRETVYSVTCRLLNPSEELMKKVDDLEDDTVLDIEGDIYKLELRDNRTYDHLIVRMSSCIIYKPTYRKQTDSL